jgi:hypothetical protein
MRTPSFIALLALTVLPAPPAMAVEGGEPPKPGPSTAGPAADPVGVPEGLENPLTALPPGSPSDQALWKTAVAANNEVVIVRAQASRIQWGAKRSGLDERLAALARQGPPEVARRAEELRQRLLDAWRQNVDYLTWRWPVDPTRACGYPLLNFATAMPDQGKDAEVLLAAARADLQTCLDRALPAIRAMKESNERFARVVAEADAALAAARPGSPPGEVAGPSAPAAPGAAALEVPPSQGTPAPTARKN